MMVPFILHYSIARLATGALLAVLFASPLARSAAAATGLQGDWLTPDKSAVAVYRCGTDLCIKIARVSPDVPYTTDGLNPNASLKSRQLCGLVIGTNFKTADTSHAEDGTLYDPKSGKTYHGSMSIDGDRLQLRGYLGLKLFGRTETWMRSPNQIEACTKSK